MLKDIYLIHHTHLDVGYTDLPLEVMDQHLIYMDEVLEACMRNGALPPERQFRWACESAILVQDYLAHRPKAHRDLLLQALREGWIELQACLTQVLTELSSAEELIRCIGYAADLGKKESFAVESAIIDDIAGYAGRLPTILSQWGIKYLLAGVGSYQAHLPWANLPHLFYLRDKSGASVLVYNLAINRHMTPQQMPVMDASYCLGATYLIHPYLEQHKGEMCLGVETDLPKVLRSTDYPRSFDALERRLEAECYPYEEVLLQCALDNRGPYTNLADAVARMNSDGAFPRIRLTTPRHFFAHMQRKYGQTIPILNGLITDPWSIRANTVPRVLKTFRQAQRKFSAGEARMSLLPETTLDGSEQALAERFYYHIQLCAEHTYGLSEWGWDEKLEIDAGCRGHAFDRYRKSWDTKDFHARAALHYADRLDRLACQRLGADIVCQGRSVLVWNDSFVESQGPAELYLGRDSGQLLSLVDAATGGDVPIQCIGQNRYLIAPPPVPSLGYRQLEAKLGSDPSQSPVCGSITPHYGLENDYLRVGVDVMRGKVTSVMSKITGRECLDCKGELGLGDFVYHVLGGLPSGAEQCGMSVELDGYYPQVELDRVSAGLTGPIASSIIMEEHVAGAAGVLRIRREIVLFSHAPRIDVRVRIDKPENGGKEACYIAFPFAGNDGTFRFDQNSGWVCPADDLLPGSMQDAFCCNSLVHLSALNGDVTLACPDAPIFQLGRIRTGRWENKLPFTTDSNYLYAWVYHNLLNTDAPVWQDVMDEFRFGVVFHMHEDFDPKRPMTASAEILNPLRAELRTANSIGSVRQAVSSLLDISPKSVRVLSVHPVLPGIARIRLEETTGTDTRVHVVCNRPIRRAQIEDFFGCRLCHAQVNGNMAEFDLAKNALTTLRMDIN